MRYVFVIAIAFTLLTACKNNQKGTETTGTDTARTTTTTVNSNTGVKVWDEQTKAAFVANCTKESKDKMAEDAAREYCNCMLEKIVAKYPNPVDANNMTIQETQEMARDCVK